MIYNNRTGTRPLLAHAPGKLQYVPLWKEMLSLSMLMSPFSGKVDNLSIVTFNNGLGTYNGKSMALFEKSADRAGLDYDVLGMNLQPWSNKLKLQLLYDYLDKICTEYVLVTDSSDVFLLRSISSIIEMFEKQSCLALFNAEKFIWPLDLQSGLIEFEQNLHFGYYLNAGLWMARKEFAKELVQFAMSQNIETAHNGSEQVYYKHCYRRFYPKIKVDVNCELFQGLNRVDEKSLRWVKPF